MRRKRRWKARKIMANPSKEMQATAALHAVLLMLARKTRDEELKGMALYAAWRFEALVPFEDRLLEGAGVPVPFDDSPK